MTHETKNELNQKAEREKLPAEVKFNKAVYGGISYVAQAAAGIALAHWLLHGKGQKYYHPMADWFGTNVLSKITSKTGAAAKEESRHWLIVGTMVMMGNAFILPVKMLENVKCNIVEKWTERDNEKRAARGEAVTDEEKQHQQKLLGELKAEPKMGWLSLLSGRLFSLVGVFGTVHLAGEANNKMVENLVTESTLKGLEKIGATGISKSKTFESYFRMTIYDMVYSAISATGLFAFSHYVNPIFNKSKKAQRAAEPAEVHAEDCLETNAPVEKQPTLPRAQVAVEALHANAAHQPLHAVHTQKHADFSTALLAAKHAQMHAEQSI